VRGTFGSETREPRDVGVGGRSVDDDAEEILGEVIDDQIVDYGACGGQQTGISALPGSFSLSTLFASA
jgi:hypothetical protein